MRTALIITLLFLLINCFKAQNDTVSVLMKKAETFLTQEDYTQASYYYGLALSYAPIDSSKGSLESIIEAKIITSDSLHAYSSFNAFYIRLLKKGDSLKKCCEIAAIRAFDQAMKIDNSYDYPGNRISDIIENSPSVQKKLLVIDARKKRALYKSEIDLALFYYEKGDLFKAMRLFERTSSMFKDDTLAKGYYTRLQIQLADEIETFDNLMYEGDSLYKKEKFKSARLKYETALTIDKECNLCSMKIKSIDYLVSRGKKIQDWELLRKEADKNFTIGNYEMAHYQFIWLYKHDNNDLYASKKILEIEKILEDELDEKKTISNAKLLLEAADHEFILGHYAKAKEIYLKIENRYSKSIGYLVYVRERIKDCQHALQEGH